jgi:hypothetical protein
VEYVEYSDLARTWCDSRYALWRIHVLCEGRVKRNRLLRSIVLYCCLGLLSWFFGAKKILRPKHYPRPRDYHNPEQGNAHTNEGTGESRPPPRRQSARLWYIPVALTIAASLTALGGYDRYREAAAGLPAPVPQEDGGILILSRQPDLSAHITLTMNTAGDFLLRLDSSKVGRFLAVFTGEALFDPGPHGDEHEPSSRIESMVVPGLGTHPSYNQYGTFSNRCRRDPSLKCIQHALRFAIDGYTPGTEGAQIESGIYLPPNQYRSPYRQNIEGRFRKQFVRSEGATVVGRTPAIAAQGLTHGWTWRGNLLRQFSSVRLSGSNEGIWYPPRKATISVEVTFSDEITSSTPTIPIGYRLDNASPATASSGELRWTLADLTSATWTMTDLRIEREQSRALFLSGILLGAALGLFAAAFERFLTLLIGTG